MIPAALLSPVAGAVALAVAASGGVAWLRLVHDPGIRAEYQAKLDAEIAAARIADQQKALAAIATLEAEHRMELAAAATTRERIIRVPITTACAAAPAVVAALDGLRARASGAGATGSASGHAGVPGRAADPSARR
jgi:hypothetical protein